MKGYSKSLEYRIIYTLTLGGNKASTILQYVTPEDFHTATTKSAFLRILKSVESKDVIPKWDDILEDPGLSAEKRKFLAKQKNIKPFRKLSYLKGAIKNLQSMTTFRRAWKLAEYITTTLNNSDELDVENFVQSIGEKTQLLNQVGEKELNIVNYGPENKSAYEVLNSILEGGDTDYIPTGFNGFDSLNVGFGRTNLVILAGPTGGGKTALSLQIADHMARNFGAKVAYVSLEMRQEEIGMRRISRLSGVPMTKLIDAKNKLTKEDRIKIKKAYKEANLRTRNMGGVETHIVPKGDITARELLAALKPRNFDVVFIDYIGLLKDADREDQWKALGAVARYAKRWAQNNNCVIVLNAQATKDQVLRYSRTVQEHANNMWTWPFDEIHQQTKVFPISQPKSRNQSNHTFYLYHDYATMSLRDATQKEIESLTNAEQNGSSGGFSKKKEEKKSLEMAYK